MPFELTVVSNTPLTPLKDLDEVAMIFLNQIGYFPKGYNPKTNAKTIKESVPYRLFMNCFLERIEKVWSVEELAAELNTSKPTVYRHINKLKSISLLEEVVISSESGEVPKKGFRIRYCNLSKAWQFVEADIKVAVENYRETVNHLQNLLTIKKAGLGDKNGR
jgi:predicted transcriptional regulator